MKKYIALLLVVCFAISMIGCTQTQAPATAAPAAAPATEAAAPAAEAAKPEAAAEAAPAFEKVTIRLAHTSQGDPDDCFQYTAERIKEKVEAATNGAVTVEIYPNSVYGNEREQFEAVMLGTVDVAIMSAANIAEFAPAFNAISLPFVFSSSQVSWKALDSEAGQAIGDSLSAVGVKGLGWAETGFRHMITNGHGIKCADDFKGMKVRAVENAIYVNAYKAWNANPTPLAWSETLTAFQQGAVDGFDIPTNIVYGSALYEMGKYFSLTSQFINCQYVVANLGWFEKLSPELQEVLLQATIDAGNEERTWLKENEEKWLADAEEHGMTIIRPEEIDFDSFKTAVTGMYDEYAEKSGGTYVYDLIEAANAAAKELQ